MKGKKLLAGLLSAAMVLGTMVMPAFADTPDEAFKQAFDSNASTITLTGDVTIDTTSSYNPVIVFNHDCTIDLAGYTLTKGSVNYIGVGSGANVTFKNGKINMGTPGDQAFLVTQGNLTFENITAEKSSSTGSWCVFADMQYLTGNSSINFDDCTMNLNGILAIAKGNDDTSSYNKLITINDTTMSTNKKTIYGGDTVLVSGNSSVSGSVYNVQNVYTIGDDASCPGATTLAATVTTAAGATSYYSTLADAMAFAKNNDGAVIKLYKNEALGQTHFFNSIDLNGKTLTLNAGSNYIEKNITISNGNIKIDGSTIADTVLNLYSWSGNAVDATFDNVNITADDFSAACGLLGAYNTNKLTYKGGSITIGNNSGVGVDAIFNGGLGSCQGEFDIQNVTVTVNGNVEKVIFCSPNAVVDGLTFTGNVEKDTFSNVSGTIKNSTFTYTNTSAMRTIVNDAGFAKELYFENVKFNDVPECTGGVFKLTANSIVKADENTEIDTTQKAFEAKVGNTYYSAFDAALEAAQAGDTITLVSDVSIGDFNFYNNIDLNNKTLTLTGDRYDLNTSGIDVTIKNGTIIVKDTENSRNGHDALFNLFGDTNDVRETLTFDNVKFYCEDGYRHWDYPAGYLFAVANGTTFKAINGTEFHVKDAVACAVFCNNAPNLGVIEFDDATIEIENTDTAFLHAMSFKDSTVTLTNVTDGLKNGTNNTKFVVDNTTITAIGGECGAKLHSETSIEFINGSTFTANKILLKNDTATVINENDNSTINAEIITETVTGPVANTVKVVYEDVTANEGEAVYDIYVVAEENTINRLTSLQMALKLDSDDDFAMTVTPADGVTRSFENGMYLFNFDGETRPSATGTKIKIGQVKLVGYGTFTLSVDETKENKAHATTNEGENLVTDFVPEAGEGQGTFDISASLEDVEIKVPTRKLTINVDFNNSVENQVAAYQDMTVTVTGPKSYEKVIKLGSDETSIENNKVVIEIADELTLNETYTVEVAGAGYRTALYSVNMNADKTLNFWNNAKDTAVEVEVGKEASKKNTTFLAGELVKDGKINIYDLSAVVSYFGTINNVGAESEYAKYDLNRDGKIDSKDVAYVLVSWGK